MKTIACIALSLVACSKGKFGGDGDQCQQITEKTKPIMKEMVEAAGKKVSDADFAKLTDECRERVKSGKGLDADSTCIAAAADEAGVRKCFDDGLKDYQRKSKGIDGKLAVHRLVRSAKMAFIENSAFVAGKAGPTPATPCCAQPDHVCAEDPTEWAKSPVWSALQIQSAESNQFQFTYESTDPKSFVVTAIGDPDCDGHPTTLTIHGSVDANNTPITDELK